jgi:hypothetical protein
MGKTAIYVFAATLRKGLARLAKLELSFAIT